MSKPEVSNAEALREISHGFTMIANGIMVLAANAGAAPAAAIEPSVAAEPAPKTRAKKTEAAAPQYDFTKDLKPKLGELLNRGGPRAGEPQLRALLEKYKLPKFDAATPTQVQQIYADVIAELATPAADADPLGIG